MSSNIRKIVKAKQELEKLSEVTSSPSTGGESKVFRGWHSRGYLPHYDAPGVFQMITYRLEDAMPANRRHEWEAFFKIQDEKLQRTKLETYLDAGYGSCHLRDSEVARLVEQAWLFFDGQKYRLAAWVVMPNHVHLLLEIWQVPLPKLMQSWKSFTSKEANRRLQRSGAFWQEDYWDRYMRDESHFAKALHYIEWNPVKAGLVNRPEDWLFSSAHPKWRWSADIPSARYNGGAHVLHKNWERCERLADGTSALLSADLNTRESSADQRPQNPP